MFHELRIGNMTWLHLEKTFSQKIFFCFNPWEPDLEPDDVLWWCHVSSDPRNSDPTSFSSLAVPSDISQFRLSTNGTFGPPQLIPIPLFPERVVSTTSDLPMTHPAGLSNGLQDLNPLPPSAASATLEPAPMEASSMGGTQNQTDGQNNQPCKYDLLSSVPRE